MAHHILMLEQVYHRHEDFEVIHWHIDYLHFPISRRADRVSFHRPALPAFLQAVTLENLVVGRTSFDLTLRRHGDDVVLHVNRRRGNAEILMSK